jgi:hypothetical protein
MPATGTRYIFTIQMPCQQGNASSSGRPWATHLSSSSVALWLAPSGTSITASPASRIPEANRARKWSQRAEGSRTHMLIQVKTQAVRHAAELMSWYRCPQHTTPLTSQHSPVCRQVPWRTTCSTQPCLDQVTQAGASAHTGPQARGCQGPCPTPRCTSFHCRLSYRTCCLMH